MTHSKLPLKQIFKRILSERNNDFMNHAWLSFLKKENPDSYNAAVFDGMPVAAPDSFKHDKTDDPLDVFVKANKKVKEFLKAANDPKVYFRDFLFGVTKFLLLVVRAPFEKAKDLTELQKLLKVTHTSTGTTLY